MWARVQHGRGLNVARRLLERSGDISKYLNCYEFYIRQMFDSVFLCFKVTRPGSILPPLSDPTKIPTLCSYSLLTTIKHQTEPLKIIKKKNIWSIRNKASYAVTSSSLNRLGYLSCILLSFRCLLWRRKFLLSGSVSSISVVRSASSRW